MIQRIQTVWLLLATLVLALMFFFPILGKITGNTEMEIHTIGLYKDVIAKPGPGVLKETFTPLFVSNIIVALLCLINIFNFRRRRSQKRIIIITIIAIGGFAFWCSIFAQRIPGGVEGANFGVAAYLPAVAILFCVLAIFGINKDEQLIRSAERLR